MNTMATRPLFGRGAPLAAAATLLVLGACADGPAAGPVGPAAPLPVPPGSTVQAITCQADVGAGTVLCRPDEGGASSGALQMRTFNQQGVHVRLANNNVRVDTVAGDTAIFSTDVTVQNLIVQRMGTRDGTTVSGITVFFHGEPNAVGGAGEVEVLSPATRGMFTAADQAYARWMEVLPLNAVTNAMTWRFKLPPGVHRFTFGVSVQTELLPVIVFDRSTGGNRDIWRVALDGSDLVQLTTNPADDRNPAAARGRVVYTTYRHGQPDVYSMPLAGGAETRLTTTTAGETDPAISADGTRVAYTSDAGGVAKVWWANADGTGAARATPATFGSSASPEAAPAWGPRGDRLALVATSDGTADLFEMVGAGTPQSLVATSFAEVNPSYSADGAFLAYATDATGAGDVYLLRLGTADAPIRLTSGAEAELYPTFTDDGRVVYLRLLAGGGAEIRWTDPDEPGSGGVVPLPAGNRPDRPYAIVF
jgi:TolB protein